MKHAAGRQAASSRVALAASDTANVSWRSRGTGTGRLPAGRGEAAVGGHENSIHDDSHFIVRSTTLKYADDLRSPKRTYSVREPQQYALQQ